MSDFLSDWSTDQLESFRVVCNLSLFICTLAVAVGVIFEKEGYPESVRTEGWRLVVKGVIGEFVFAVALWQLDSTIGFRQDLQVAGLYGLYSQANSRAGVARRQAAVALKQAEELKAENLKLEAQIQPRRLSADDIAALKTAVKPFSNRQISVWSYGTDLEGRILATQILSALNDIHVPTVDSIGHMVSSTTARIGVIVTGPDDELIGALLTALKPLSPTRGSLSNPGSHSKSGVDMLYGGLNVAPAEVFVGIKPISP